MWKACGDTCDACAKACNTAFRHCVIQAAAGKAQHARMAQTVADCAAFCGLSARCCSAGVRSPCLAVRRVQTLASSVHRNATRTILIMT